VSSIEVPQTSPKDRAALEGVKRRWVAEAETLTRLESEKNKAWAQFNEAQRTGNAQAIPYAKWYEGSRFASFIAQQQAKVTKLRQEYTSLVPPGLTTVYQAIDRARDPANQATVASPSGEVSCPVYALSPSLEQFLTQKQTVVWEPQQQNRQSSKTSNASAQATLSGPLVRLERNKATQSKTVQQEQIGVKVTFANLGLLRIEPGAWFSKALLNLYKDGPFHSGSPNVKSLVDNTLHPTHVLVAHGATFILDSSKEYYSALKEAYGASGGISIGPYRFSASTNSAQTVVMFDDVKRRLTIADSPGAPMILAVISEGVR
jgi:hypothetical protein